VRRLVGLMALLLAVLWEVSPPGALAEETSRPPSAAHISYLTGSSAYVDAGQEEGLREGDELQVVRGGKVIATLKVAYLSGHRASCTIAGASAPLAVGDTVLYTSSPPARALPGAAAQATGAPTGGEAREKGRQRGAISGRVGARTLIVRDRSGNDNGFSQPGLDLRVDGTALAGGFMDFNIDVRDRRTYRTAPGPEGSGERESRVYRLAVTTRLPDPRQRVTVGRQFAPALASLSLFDGALYELTGEHVDGGIMAGTQPDPVDMRISGDISEYGGYFRFHSLTLAPRRWTVTTGAIGSYTQGNVNREFFYLQGQYSGRRLSAFGTQEVDYNRGWKVAETGESTLVLTSTFASTHLRAGEHLTFFGGYDNRRNVRLYRDRVTPETEFDDSFRRGIWGGLSARIGPHLLTGVEARSSQGGVSGKADSYSLNLGAEGLGRPGLGFHGRGTRFTSDETEGSLNSLGIGMNLGPVLHLELEGGAIRHTSRITPGLDDNLRWVGLDLDAALGRRWYLLFSAQRNDGDMERNDQVYASVAYRL